MKKNFTKNILLVLALSAFANLQLLSQDYTWKRGTNLLNQQGSYGTLGFTSNLNDPGSREGSLTWKDFSGNFWLFGGFGLDENGAYGFLNDLWKYDPINNLWTWINGNKLKNMNGIYLAQGIPDPGNKPGSRAGSTGWVDSNGNFWMFGGYGFDDSSPNQGELNDLWKYDVINDEWTWVNGSSSLNQSGTYGTLGAPASANIPGARYASISWTDNTGDLWLFGGYGFDGFSAQGYMNDLWRYNRIVNEWTWVNGNIAISQNGLYGTLGVASSSNNPGARYFSSGWYDGSGNLWLFGGDGFDVSGGFGSMNDLWKYDALNNEWTWMKGSNTYGQFATYGTQGVSSSANLPGAGNSAMTWTDGSGSFWLFGGFGFASLNTPGYLNDLWKYNPINNQWVWIKGINFVNQQSAYGTLNVSNPLNRIGARKSSACWTDGSSNLYLFGGNGYNDVTQGELNDMWRFGNCISKVKAVSSRSTICVGETATLTANSAASYNWSNGLTVQSIVIKPNSTTTYTVEGLDNYACAYTSTITQVTKNCLGISSNTNDTGLLLYPNPSKGSFKIQMPQQLEKTDLIIMNSLGQKVLEEILENNSMEFNTNLVKGIYYYRLKSSGKTVHSGKLIVE